MTLSITIVAAFLLITAYLTWRGYRGTKNATDYLLGGRDTHPFVMALSYGATFISTSAIVGFGGAAAVFGMGLLWLTFLNIIVGIFIAFVFFGARTRKMGHHLNAHTFPELIAKRYDSKFIQLFSGSLIFVAMPLYAAVVMMGACKFLEVQFNLDYTVVLLLFALLIAAYVIVGGLKGVMLTDALQGAIMFVGMIVLLVATYNALGGFTEAHEALGQINPGPLAKKGHQGWTSMPAFGTPYWWVLVSTIIMGVGIGVLAQPQLAVRFMTVKSKKELNRAVLVGGIFILVMTGVAFLVGSLSNVFFFQHPEFGKISIIAAMGQIDKIMPLYIEKAMPSWFSLVFMLTLLAAALSTLSSQFHTMGTSIGRDVFEQVSKAKTTDRSTAMITKVGIVTAIFVATFLGWWLPETFKEGGVAIVARGTAIFFGLCAATFLPAYVGGLYLKGITKAGAIGGMLTGFISSAFWLLFCHTKESSALKLCEMIFGTPSLVKGKVTGFVIWEVVDPMFVSLPAAILVTILVSLLTRKTLDKKHVQNCFSGI